MNAEPEAADTEMAAMLAAYAALGTLSPRAQGRALNWLEARLQDEADRGAGGTTGRARVGWLRAPSAACIVQASGSHGFVPDLRLRLWFWCDRPMAGAELKRWLCQTPADLCVIGPAQLIYTAASVMAGAAPDPLPARLVALPGGAELRCPSPEALAPRPRPAARHITVTSTGASKYATAALRNAVVRILRAERRHPTIMAEACGLARLVRAGLLAEGDMRHALHAAAADPDKPREEVEAILAWALANPSNGAVPELRHG